MSRSFAGIPLVNLLLLVWAVLIRVFARLGARESSVGGSHN
jgi:hypothetical protein